MRSCQRFIREGLAALAYHLKSAQRRTCVAIVIALSRAGSSSLGLVTC